MRLWFFPGGDCGTLTPEKHKGVVYHGIFGIDSGFRRHRCGGLPGGTPQPGLSYRHIPSAAAHSLRRVSWQLWAQKANTCPRASFWHRPAAAR